MEDGDEQDAFATNAQGADGSVSGVPNDCNEQVEESRRPHGHYLYHPLACPLTANATSTTVMPYGHVAVAEYPSNAVAQTGVVGQLVAALYPTDKPKRRAAAQGEGLHILEG